MGGAPAGADLLSGRGGIDARAAHRRRQAEENPREQRHRGGEGEDPPVGMRIQRHRRSPVEIMRTSTRLPHHASGSASAPPIEASTRLSVRNCRTSRPRLAPNARRTAISRRRPEARASSRLATLAQATSNTMPATAHQQLQRKSYCVAQCR